MRLGIGLPQVGPVAGPEALVRVAQHAEAIGYDDAWVFDRVLWPVAPRAPYPAASDGRLPDACKIVLDPVGTLTFVAAHTSRLGLGTSVLNLPYYNPVLLARQLTTLDVLSGGRLRVGLGTGWSPDEFDAVGVPMRRIGRRTNEALRVLQTIWTTDPVEFEGEFFRVPKSVMFPKPIQRPHPPLYWAAFTPAALQRVARDADGWMPAGIPAATIAPIFAQVRAQAQAAGRDAARLQLVVRGNVYLTPDPLGADRMSFTGSLEQVRADIAAVKAIGADALILDVQMSPEITTVVMLLDRITRLREIAHA